MSDTDDVCGCGYSTCRLCFPAYEVSRDLLERCLRDVKYGIAMAKSESAITRMLKTAGELTDALAQK